MTLDPAPPLQLSTIAEAATPQSLERGRRYYQQGRLVNPRRQGRRLWAGCYGSDLYETTVTLNPDGTIAIFHCTCPYDWGGICKHQVALLLAYLHQPQQFQAIAPLSELLGDRSREALIDLIEQMLQQHPDLLDFIQVFSQEPEAPPLDLAAYRQQIAAKLRHLEYEEGPVDLLGVEVAWAHRTLEAGDFIQAGHLYSTFLEVVSEQYETLVNSDEAGILGHVTQDVVSNLRECFALAGDDLTGAVQQRWIQVCWLAWRQDLAVGGYGYVDGIDAVLLDWGTQADWQHFEQELREVISSGVRGWARRQAQELLQAYYQRREAPAG